MKSLLFVYNAKSDYWSKKIDFAHKIISPSTYACSLCALTHGNFGETEVWKEFRLGSNFKMKFIYKNEFQKTYPNIKPDYPVIFIKESNTEKLSVLIDSNELAKIKTVENLISVLKLKLKIAV